MNLTAVESLYIRSIVQYLFFCDWFISFGCIWNVKKILENLMRSFLYLILWGSGSQKDVLEDTACLFIWKKIKISPSLALVTCSVQEITQPNYPLRRHEVFSTVSKRRDLQNFFALLVICSACFSAQVCTLMQNCGVTAPAGGQHHPPHHLPLASPTHIVCSWACFLWTASGGGPGSQAQEFLLEHLRCLISDMNSNTRIIL